MTASHRVLHVSGVKSGHGACLNVEADVCLFFSLKAAPSYAQPSPCFPMFVLLCVSLNIILGSKKVISGSSVKGKASNATKLLTWQLLFVLLAALGNVRFCLERPM